MAIDLQETFEKFDEQYIKFDQATGKLNDRPDLCAFILLDKLVPGNRDIISAAEHDVFYIEIDLEKLAEVATEENIALLVSCGVMYDSELDCLSMFA